MLNLPQKAGVKCGKERNWPTYNPHSVTNDRASSQVILDARIEYDSQFGS